MKAQAGTARRQTEDGLAGPGPERTVRELPSLLDDCDAHCVVTAVKDNQPRMVDDLRHMLFAERPDHETLEKEHGHIDRRRCWVKAISDPGWKGYAGLYGHRQAIPIAHEWHVLKTGKTITEVRCALASPTAEQAAPADLAALVRNHCHIESRLHCVRDFT